MSNVNNLFDFITNKFSNEEVYSQVDEAMYDYIDRDVMEEEGLDEYEYYSEYGRGEAESQVIYDLINEAKKELNIITSSDKVVELFNLIAEHYTLNTN